GAPRSSRRSRRRGGPRRDARGRTTMSAKILQEPRAEDAAAAAPPASAADLQAALARACADVPDVISAALVLLPDGYLLAGLGQGGLMEHDLLARATGRCFGAVADEFVEFYALLVDRVVLWQRGRGAARLALCIVSERRVNLALLLSASRAAVSELERQVDAEVFDE